ncbi:trimethylamine methyltransferase family protein [Yoonia sediminilitoris]|uniref:Methyltransferase n=1 Tax=Yoonia sediminilitoris TaxID=1286148 RepID=A0A2T6KB51_9RHOB|nr:trimethylamine methyltransferase family protein [Yoonia sediminilitoris]PUB12099.1 trimethylamine--corrinoid protein Co-methyltransferase [Yoonia sediminilitoris]RCW92926.1 trimethylamine--corrinoid protein Co-methyltransferase [Yoonia sediminilitoris]
MDQAGKPRRRSGGRAGNAARRGQAAIDQMPWKPPVNIDRPTEPLPTEGVQAIHDGAMRILEEIGIEFLNDEAIALFRQAGCTVNGSNVRMGREWVMEMLGHAPAQFDITPRNPDRKITIGGKHILFGNVSSPPNYFDLEIGKKVSGSRAQCADLLRLTQYFNCIHFAGGYPVEPVDVHPSVRHLDVVYDKMVLTDKVPHAYSLGKERVEDVMEMIKIAGGLTEEEFTAAPHMYTNINSTSPLKHDVPMIDGCLRCIRRGQAVIVTPFTLAGAMAPVTMAGAVSLSIAEALSAIALFQYVRPGAPCVIGTFTSNVDMKSGAPAFGTPEYMRATQMTGQMARFYGLPMRASGSCAANVPDGQAMWETSNALWSAVQSGTNIVYHAAGWLEGGLVASPEKFIMDCEVLQMIQRYMDPAITATGPDDIAIDAIKEVGPNGHFFGITHTQDRYEAAFYQPFLSDWRNFEAWEAAGSVWTAERAHRIFKEIIGSFEEPPMDDGIKEALGDFVARRKAEGGAPTDF